VQTLALCAVVLVSVGPACSLQEPQPGLVAFWCADRDAGWVHGVDEQLYVSRSMAVERPVFLESGPADSVWVVSANRGRDAPHGIHRIDPNAVRRGDPDAVSSVGSTPLHEVGAVLACAAERGRLWFLERRLRGVVLSSVSAAGGLERRAALPAAECLSAAAGRVAVGTREERLLIFETGASASPLAPTAVHRLPGVPTHLRPGPAGQWWVALSDPARLLLVHESAGMRWSRPSGLRDVLLGDGGVELEVVDALRGTRVVFDLAGVRSERERLPLRGIAAGVRQVGRRLVYCSPGALYLLDENSNRESTQGGFEFLADLIAAR